ncbi:MAG: cobaltochelatase subunit CobN [Thermanaeromonas sp.]|nr:cobaltochelatase subunit CobN [Thermanaeromonas sp.]MCG0278436.1 cobaltochelatase subunit CobN [Thermanaeromonas sp.]
MEGSEGLGRYLHESYVLHYGKSVYGVPARDVFEEILKTVDIVTQVRDSVWGVLDNDDVAQYLGGLKLAAQAASGEEVQAYIINTRTGSARVQSFSEFVSTELRSRLFNPKWIEGMLKEGYAGAREIGKHVANMFLVDATLEGISDWAWQKVAETFIFDEKIRNQLDPFVVQSIIGWSLEAARRQMWQTDQETLSRLANIYVQTAAQYGVVCCHHTCANIKFNEWVATYSTLDSSTFTRFKEIFSKATNKEINLEIPEKPTAPEDQSLTQNQENNAVDESSVPEPFVPAENIQQLAESPPPYTSIDQKAEQIEETLEVEQPTSSSTGEVKEAAEDILVKQEQPLQPRTVSTAGPGSGQDTTSDTPQTGSEQGAESKSRAYELEVTRKTQVSTSARKAVSFAAIVAALGLMALFIKGYFTGRKL